MVDEPGPAPRYAFDLTLERAAYFLLRLPHLQRGAFTFTSQEQKRRPLWIDACVCVRDCARVCARVCVHTSIFDNEVSGPLCDG